MYWELSAEDLEIMGLTMDQAAALAGVEPTEIDGVLYLCFTADDENPLDGVPDIFQSTTPTPDVTMKPSQGHAGG